MSVPSDFNKHLNDGLNRYGLVQGSTLQNVRDVLYHGGRELNQLTMQRMILATALAGLSVFTSIISYNLGLDGLKAALGLAPTAPTPDQTFRGVVEAKLEQALTLKDAKLKNCIAIATDMEKQRNAAMANWQACLDNQGNIQQIRNA